MLFSLTTTNGTVIHYRLLRTAKKNIIVRAQNDGCLRVNIPPFVNKTALNHWLSSNENALLELWTTTQTRTRQHDTLPTELWFHGKNHPCRTVPAINAPQFDEHNGFALPASQADQSAIKRQLRRWLQQQARTWLLPPLAQRAQIMNVQPAAMALSNARTLWGVCRPRTGIRLNWRLIGAPDWVVDYVCVHELCHLVHPNHSTDFWTMVAQHTPHTKAAKNWLKAHGTALFALDE